MKRTLRLRGIGGATKGRVWESETLLRAGRLASLEIVLDDSSVSRRHAEVRIQADGTWAVRDLESTNGTWLNGTRLDPAADYPVKPRDVVQFGKVAMVVELADATVDGPPSDQLVLAASTRSHFDGSFPNINLDSHTARPGAEVQLRALLQAGQHLVHLEKEDDLLRSILADCVRVLDAQRGAIVLADGETREGEPKLERRALAVGARQPRARFAFSKRLIQQCFAAGESRLFKNVLDEQITTASISDGAMTSVICVLLRTPRKKLGVMHLDRGPLQAQFTTDDLALADALAAAMSVGIECAQLLTKQKDLLHRTLETFAQMVDQRDDYTGGHTRRVRRYAELLATRLESPDDQVELIRLGSPLHDIGKVAISDSILLAPRRLTGDELKEMQSHTTKGAAWLENIPELRGIVPIVRHHHERWDGRGYPDGLARTNIPILARIVSVADSFDAMTSVRTYHAADRDRSAEAAFAELERQAGRQFDPDCVVKFLEIKDLIIQEMQPRRNSTACSPALDANDTLAGDAAVPAIPAGPPASDFAAAG